MGLKQGKPHPRRGELIALSAELKPLVKAGVFASVNEGLRELYSKQAGSSDWDTFRGWLSRGRCVRKGERGFPIWAKPRRLGGGDAGGDLAALGAMLGVNGPDDEGGRSWFPVAYIFHAGQVDVKAAGELELEGV